MTTKLSTVTRISIKPVKNKIRHKSCLVNAVYILLNINEPRNTRYNNKHCLASVSEKPQEATKSSGWFPKSLRSWIHNGSFRAQNRRKTPKPIAKVIKQLPDIPIKRQNSIHENLKKAILKMQRYIKRKR